MFPYAAKHRFASRLFSEVSRHAVRHEVPGATHVLPFRLICPSCPIGRASCRVLQLDLMASSTNGWGVTCIAGSCPLPNRPTRYCSQIIQHGCTATVHLTGNSYFRIFLLLLIRRRTHHNRFLRHKTWTSEHPKIDFASYYSVFRFHQGRML